ncbi:hypothetical protein MBCUT_06880 [Methanobrevibacter cuticularis]|uniref:Uncharacterized protein n=1 Tax=Methanobrevibacter cuticularis TaxID=47311 RepID=A0A166EH42_9EURY|nr:hypothetical protein [Methanobrevibacter cuticularis]KZX16650.1 hypothetical protein MBCUT_06880 [Methanobrevibacter cuticularis]
MNFIGGTPLVKSMREITPLQIKTIGIINKIHNKIIKKNIKDNKND